jgi:hypothetical protein
LNEVIETMVKFFKINHYKIAEYHLQTND